MRWIKFEKMVLDHPLFEYQRKHFRSTRRNAKRRLRNGYPSLEETIEAAKKRSGLPEEAWADFDAAIARQKAREEAKRSSSLTGLWLNFVMVHRCVAVLCLILILILSFFTILPSGRVMARDLFNMVVRVVDDRLIIRSADSDYNDFYFGDVSTHHPDTVTEEGNDAEEPVYYPDIQAFTEDTGFVPVVLKADWLELKTIYSITDEHLGVTLMTEYQTSEELSVYVTQTWGPEVDRFSRVKGATFQKAIIMDGKEFYHVIDPIDGTFSGTVVLDDSLFDIGAEKGVDGGALIDLLKGQ